MPNCETDTLPVGTRYFPQNREYHYKAFVCEDSFLMRNPGFNWDRYIEKSLHLCLEPTINRFLRIV